MSNDNAKKIKVGAVQMESKNGLIDANLDRAVGFVEQAVSRGAQMVVLPEFLPTGYVFTKAIWDAGEPRDGKTVQWLREHSKRLGVYLATSFLEAEGEDFYNTFVMTRPDGTESGRVRKQTPASFEAYFTKGEAGPHTIETEFGRVGVGICYENQLWYTPGLMSSQSVDLMLMPHSAPTPTVSPFFPKGAVEIYNRTLKDLSVKYATMLGIPAVFVNKCGPWYTPLPGLPSFLDQNSKFPGFTSIADSDGVLKVQLGDEEGVIVEEVSLDPSRKTGTVPECKGRWALDVPWATNIFRLIEAVGGLWYRHSSERVERARKILSGV